MLWWQWKEWPGDQTGVAIRYAASLMVKKIKQEANVEPMADSSKLARQIHRFQ
jgi:hypothetical protein